MKLIFWLWSVIIGIGVYGAGKVLIYVYNSYKKFNRNGRSDPMTRKAVLRRVFQIGKWDFKVFLKRIRYRVFKEEHEHLLSNIDNRCRICYKTVGEIDRELNARYPQRRRDMYGDIQRIQPSRWYDEPHMREVYENEAEEEQAGDYEETFNHLAEIYNQLNPTAPYVPLKPEGNKKMKKTYFTIGEYLKVQLDGSTTNVYIKQKDGSWNKFRQCKYLLLHLEGSKTYEEIESIDDAVKKLKDNDLERDLEVNHMEYEIPPKTEFFGHCSNLHAWYEHDYDLRLIHTNLGLPLLRELVEVGEPKAEISFKEEIMYRLEKTGFNAYRMFDKDIIRHFSNEEKEVVFNILKEKVMERLEAWSVNTSENVSGNEYRYIIKELKDLNDIKRSRVASQEKMNQIRLEDLEEELANVQPTEVQPTEELFIGARQRGTAEWRYVRETTIDRHQEIFAGEDEDDDVSERGDFLDTIVRASEKAVEIGIEVRNIMIYSYYNMFYKAQTYFYITEGVSEIEKIQGLGRRSGIGIDWKPITEFPSNELWIYINPLYNHERALFPDIGSYDILFKTGELTYEGGES